MRKKIEEEEEEEEEEEDWYCTQATNVVNRTTLIARRHNVGLLGTACDIHTSNYAP